MTGVPIKHIVEDMGRHISSTYYFCKCEGFMNMMIYWCEDGTIRGIAEVTAIKRSSAKLWRERFEVGDDDFRDGHILNYYRVKRDIMDFSRSLRGKYDLFVIIEEPEIENE